MCGRYSITSDGYSIGKQLDIEVASELFAPNYNAVPTNSLPIITKESPSLLQAGRWGFVSGFGSNLKIKNLVINARQESIFEKKMFSHLANLNRCLIPADGFYEWQKGGKPKQPFRFTLKSEELFSFAGLFQYGKDEGSVNEISFVILTTAANSLVGELHNRMPVIISKESQEEWLTLPWKELQQVFEPYPAAKMKGYKVTPKINSAAYKSKDSIIPWQDPNLTLF
jgi:putative SOS response-associated peptidase YedK